MDLLSAVKPRACLLVSDQPMTPEGVKTAKSDKTVTEKYLRFEGIYKPPCTTLDKTTRNSKTIVSEFYFRFS
jgi:hypothetical protein